MKRIALIVIGALLATAAVAAGSIALYEYFRPARASFGDTPLVLERNADSTAREMARGAHTGAAISLVQALDIAALHVPGEVIKVELEDKHGRSIYEIKVLTSTGRVREVELDARSGAVIEIEDD